MSQQIRTHIIFFIFLSLSVSIQAQIDSKKKNVSIPAIENDKDTLDASPTTPVKSLGNIGNFGGITTPKPTPNLSMPKKEFSMFGEDFGDPGELYADRLKKHQNSITDKLELGSKGSKVDVFFGNHRTKSKTVQVLYRDYGLEDGDLIRVSVNDEIVEYRVGLVNTFRGFTIKLREGVNKIEFLALNEGYALPNTAHFRVVDENNNIVAADMWALSVNVKGTVNIIKDPN
ncbi:hypothetical protein [Seonamhaeicola aphaedonensis]|uniref:Secreted protein n=1 Tax=Seonamhaeicola aphaedonensis TaxID=1461338 RepID=A0A3D9HKB6_9FLAO|nr:hypothetical protein [Seonamhaeicola aphaedonensis]RED49356.1 hypothetical protein DFQ02_102128 [Seonamhaeicola aphaedonensis]